MYNLKRRSARRSFSSRKIALAVIVVVIVVFLALEVSGVTHVLRKPPAKTATISSTPVDSSGKKAAKSSQKAAAQSSPSDTTTQSPKSTSIGDNSSSAKVTLIKPYGSFISNHRVSDATPQTESSVCNTTPGASCYIKFTKDDLVRTLPVGVSDNNGSVYWNDWDVSSFPKGSWQVTAIATINGETVSSTDSANLEIN